VTDRPDRAAEAQRAREYAAQLRSGHVTAETLVRVAHVLDRLADLAERTDTEPSAN
jgi:glycyl-tRNA synthetase beta subunit